MPDFAVHVKVTNQTKETLELVKAENIHGDWDGVPDHIAPGATVDFNLKDGFGFYGTEGTFIYSIGSNSDSSPKFKAFQRCPFSDSNDVNTNPPAQPASVYVVQWKARSAGNEWLNGNVQPTGHPVWVNYDVEYEKSHYRFRLERITAKSDHPIRNSRDEVIVSTHDLWDREHSEIWDDADKGSFEPNAFGTEFTGRDSSVPQQSSFTVFITPVSLELVGAECILFGYLNNKKIIQSDYFVMKQQRLEVITNVVGPTPRPYPFVYNGDIEWGMELRRSGNLVECDGPKRTRLELYWMAKKIHPALKKGIPVQFLRTMFQNMQTLARAPPTQDWAWMAAGLVWSNWNKTYDSIAGASAFGLDVDGGNFNITYYVAADSSGVPGTLSRYVNCMDQAAALQMAFSLGNINEASWLVQQPFGYIQPINLVGVVDEAGNYITCNNPFFGADNRRASLELNDPERNPFYVHVYCGDHTTWYPDRHHILNATGGPNRGTRLIDHYINTTIDTATTLYDSANTEHGTEQNVREGNGITGIDGSAPTTSRGLLSSDRELPGRVSRMLGGIMPDLDEIMSGTYARFLDWAKLPEWAKVVLGEHTDVLFQQMKTGIPTTQVCWRLNGVGEGRIRLDVDVYVESCTGADGTYDRSRSVAAVRHCIAHILLSTDRDPEDLWITSHLEGYGQRVLQYAEHIPSGRMVLLCENVVIDVRGASSTAELKPFVYQLLERTLRSNVPVMHMPSVTSIRLLPSNNAEEIKVAKYLVRGLDTRFSVLVTLDSDIAAAAADVEGLGILVRKCVVEKLGGGSTIQIEFHTREIGKHITKVSFADLQTLVTGHKMLEIEVTEKL